MNFIGPRLPSSSGVMPGRAFLAGEEGRDLGVIGADDFAQEVVGGTGERRRGGAGAEGEGGGGSGRGDEEIATIHFVEGGGKKDEARRERTRFGGEGRKVNCKDQ
jgi:hypothetical protein